MELTAPRGLTRRLSQLGSYAHGEHVGTCASRHRTGTTLSACIGRVLEEHGSSARRRGA